MPYEYYQPNPKKQRVDDCAIRALCKVLSKEWGDVYSMLCSEGLHLCDIPTSNYVIGMVLRNYGYEQEMMPSTCPACTTVFGFTVNHPKGKYVLITEDHAVAVVDGIYYDTFDCGEELAICYYYERE